MFQTYNNAVKTIVCSITKKKNFSDTVIWHSLKKYANEIDHVIKTNNTTQGLSRYYNECIEEYKNYDSVVFVHDDVDIINKDLIYQLEEGFKLYDILGVAGCMNPKIIEKNLWHWMAGDKENMRGIAGHPCSEKEFFVTSFGPTPSRAVIIDGVFMAINLKKLYASNARFDEQFNFHHYDIDFSLTCNKNKLKMGVWPILINHQSPGLKDFHNEWNESNKRFIQKWKNK
jgi:hypothetical protein